MYYQYLRHVDDKSYKERKIAPPDWLEDSHVHTIHIAPR